MQTTVKSNPYFIGPPVKDPKMFFGREDEVTYITSKLRTGNCVSVIGLQRIGKTSLLRYLVYNTTLPEGDLSVYIDLQHPSTHHPLSMLSLILKGMYERLGVAQDNTIDSLTTFTNAVERLTNQGYRPIIFLDEIEKIAERSDFDDDFFDMLRALVTARQVTYVTASTRPLPDLRQTFGRGSPFFNVFSDYILKGLPKEGAHRLFEEPFRRAGFVPPSESHMEIATSLSGHHPMYLQLVAGQLFQWRSEDNTVLDRQVFQRAFTREGRGHFQALIGQLRRFHPELLMGVKWLAGISVPIRNSEMTRQALLDYGLAEGTSEAPYLFSSVFADMIKSGELERDPFLPQRPSTSQTVEANLIAPTPKSSPVD